MGRSPAQKSCVSRCSEPRSSASEKVLYTSVVPARLHPTTKTGHITTTGTSCQRSARAACCRPRPKSHNDKTTKTNSTHTTQTPKTTNQPHYREREKQKPDLSVILAGREQGRAARTT